MSSSSSTQRTRIQHGNSTRRMLLASTSDKENVNNQAKATSDISDDEEQMECEPVPHQVARKTSAVHEFATKLSPQDYQCKLCSKVNIHPILLQTVLQDD